MASSQKSKRARRRRRKPGAAPRAVPSSRRHEEAQRRAQTVEVERRASRQLGREGERPPGLFGGVPVSEIAILAGLIAAVVGFLDKRTAVLVVGLVVCGLGTFEVTGREHFSGFRQHSALLAAIPAVAIEAAIVFIAGDPSHPGVLLVIVVPVFGGLFWVLRRRFQTARQARVARAARGVAPAE